MMMSIICNLCEYPGSKMDYAEASYFDGAHFAHIAAWRDRQRLLRIDAQCHARGRRDHGRGLGPSARPVVRHLVRPL